MSGEQNLMKLLATLQPELHSGDFVFCSVENTTRIGEEETVMVFREAEGVAVIMKHINKTE
ncbi:MAG TPA: ACT domain-containing protein [Puia sp.]|nr:ACT domain-containing protein [Puia sp.]